ncbi:zinc finger protein 354B-like isoform X2 [Castor canadensis]|uniref:Zinc finger protein 354B-like isoform X2 n=1 Tax=Castor canadensis TaxID=51338 RepID=A0AC58LC17_CASCN
MSGESWILLREAYTGILREACMLENYRHLATLGLPFIKPKVISVLQQDHPWKAEKERPGDFAFECGLSLGRLRQEDLEFFQASLGNIRRPCLIEKELFPFPSIPQAHCADRSCCFMLSGGIVKGALAGIWKFVRTPGAEGVLKMLAQKLAL